MEQLGIYMYICLLRNTPYHTYYYYCLFHNLCATNQRHTWLFCLFFLIYQIENYEFSIVETQINPP